MLDHRSRKTGNNPKMTWGTAQPTALLRGCMVRVCSSGFEVGTLTGIVVCSWSPCQSLKRLLQVQGVALSKFRPLGLSQHGLHCVLPCPLSWGLCFYNALSQNAFLGDLISSHQSWKDDLCQVSARCSSHRMSWCQTQMVCSLGPMTS